jgi:hypothetical protein
MAILALSLGNCLDRDNKKIVLSKFRSNDDNTFYNLHPTPSTQTP